MRILKYSRVHHGSVPPPNRAVTHSAGQVTPCALVTLRRRYPMLPRPTVPATTNHRLQWEVIIMIWNEWTVTSFTLLSNATRDIYRVMSWMAKHSTSSRDQLQPLHCPHPHSSTLPVNRSKPHFSGDND